MTAAEWIAVAIFLVGVIFTSGKIVSGNSSEVRQLKSDLNGIGKKMRRQHNLEMLIVAMTDDRIERFKMIAFLKED